LYTFLDTSQMKISTINFFFLSENKKLQSRGVIYLVSKGSFVFHFDFVFLYKGIFTFSHL
jgi:hypothetical protein